MGVSPSIADQVGVGLLRFDRERRGFVRYRNNRGDSESLAEDKVTEFATRSYAQHRLAAVGMEPERG